MKPKKKAVAIPVVAPREFEVDFFVRVKVTVTDPRVISDVVNNVDGWQDHLYKLTTEREVVEHLAYNCARNGVTEVRQLDGWAGVERDAARMEITDCEVED